MVDLLIDLVALFLLYIFFPFSLFVSVYVYASLCDFVCKALLLPFVPGFCESVFFFIFVYILVLVIIGGLVFWCGCSLLSFFYYFLIFLFLIIFLF